MTSFSSLLSSIGGQPSVPLQPSSTVQKPSPAARPERKTNDSSNGARLGPSVVAAGVKRKSEEPEPGPRSKTAKLRHDDQDRRSSSAVPTSRFQLSAKSNPSQKQALPPNRPSPKPAVPLNHQRVVPKPVPKQPSSATPAQTTPAPSSSAPAKRGFASIMEKAKAAQEAAQAVGSSSIKHKTVEKLSKRERLRLVEEEKARQKAGKRAKPTPANHSRNDTPVGAAGGQTGLQKKGQDIGYKGTMKKAVAPLLYKGTMHAGGSALGKAKGKKAQPEDKYGGYASQSDLDDAEDEEDYESEGSSDMEGGFDDMEREEFLSSRAARKEDQAALAEEERLKREKLERKRRLQELSKGVAAKKRF